MMGVIVGVVKTACGPVPVPLMYAVARMVPLEFLRMTAPLRSPGAWGVKATLTVQVAPAATAPLHVLPVPSLKSRPAEPCVSTFVFASAGSVPAVPMVKYTVVCAAAVPTGVVAAIKEPPA
jgi:hypothetical protein